MHDVHSMNHFSYNNIHDVAHILSYSNVVAKLLWQYKSIELMNILIIVSLITPT